MFQGDILRTEVFNEKSDLFPPELVDLYNFSGVIRIEIPGGHEMSIHMGRGGLAS